jgi:hypothetical protein
MIIPKKKISFFNRYYYHYVDSFISFLIPPGVRARRVEQELESDDNGYSRYDYLVMTDLLGYVSDIQEHLSQAVKLLEPDGHLVITQYSTLWEPVLRLASFLGLRRKEIEQNWLTLNDLKNFGHLAGLETVKSGSKILIPLYLPLISWFFNRILVNLFPFSRFGLFHYLVLRHQQVSDFEIAPSLSIIVAARNEEGTIERIAKELPALGEFTEVVFIEGGSSDNTLEEIKRVVKEVKTGKKLSFGVQTGKGKGDAVRLGFEMAKGDIVTIYDADMTVPPNDIKKFYQALVENKGEFINGSRLVYPMEKESMRLLNFVGNKFFSFAFSWILGQSLKDTLCGTKMLWKKDYEAIKRGRAFFGDFDPFGDFDLLFGAAKLNLKIIDLPIRYGERVYGSTNISRWSHGWLLLRMTFFAARKIKFI